MDIVVTVKQVPDPDIPPTHFKVDEGAKKVIPPAGVSPVMNGYDAHALEAALRLKEQLGGKVTVISLGPDTARDTLKRAIAMGADAAVHVNDPALNDADSTTTALALATAIKKLDHVDLVLCGRQASDTDGGQVHLGVASHLGLPAVSPVQKIDEASADSLVAERIVEDGYQRLKIRLPALLGVSSEINEPRDVLNKVEGGFVELPRCRDRGFCCGAGGARAFMEEKRGTRISHNRLNEAIGTDANGVAVACPFCVTMFEDGVRALNVEETFAVRDIAEIVADALTTKD